MLEALTSAFDPKRTCQSANRVPTHAYAFALVKGIKPYCGYFGETNPMRDDHRVSGIEARNVGHAYFDVDSKPDMRLTPTK
jgi:hypothetical protein